VSCGDATREEAPREARRLLCARALRGSRPAVHGASLETDDVDICLPGDTENLARVSLALQRLVAEQRPPTSEADHQVSFDTPFGRLDIIESDEEFAVLNANATDVNMLGRWLAIGRRVGRMERESGSAGLHIRKGRAEVEVRMTRHAG
jgi:hypothetical protein